MDATSLPYYPRPEPPPTAPEAAPDRRRGLLLQFLVLIALWAGIYVLREQARAFSEAHNRAEAKKAIMGRWEAIRAPGVELELRDGRFTVRGDNTRFRQGQYEWNGERLRLLIRSSSGIAGYWSLHCQLTSEELTLWDDGTQWGSEGNWFLILNVLGREAAPRAYAQEKVLRFRRVGQ